MKFTIENILKFFKNAKVKVSPSNENEKPFETKIKNISYYPKSTVDEEALFIKTFDGGLHYGHEVELEITDDFMNNRNNWVTNMEQQVWGTYCYFLPKLEIFIEPQFSGDDCGDEMFHGIKMYPMTQDEILLKYPKETNTYTWYKNGLISKKEYYEIELERHMNQKPDVNKFIEHEVGRWEIIKDKYELRLKKLSK